MDRVIPDGPRALRRIHGPSGQHFRRDGPVRLTRFAPGGLIRTMAKGREATARLRILIGAAVALGPGKADLLDAVAETGSISAAARAMGMSYRRAWTLIEAINRDFRTPLIETSAGGAGGGGARVTDAGSEALRRYRAMEEKASAAVSDEIAAFSELLRKPSDID